MYIYIYVLSHESANRENQIWALKKIDIANIRTPDHIIKIMQHYHRTKCMHMVLMHVTIFWTQIIRI